MTSKATQPTPDPNPASAPEERKKVFVVSPIGAPGTEVYQKAAYALKYIFRRALQEDKWDVHRADEGKSPDSIGQHVIRKLYEADLVIADLTGHNPNVFYELAIAHGWRKPVVHLIAKGEKVPFDIVDQRTIFYDITDLASVEDSIELLREYAESAIENAAGLVTPLSSFEMFNTIRTDDADGGAAVAGMLEQVVLRLSRLEGRLTGGAEYRVKRDREPERMDTSNRVPMDTFIGMYNRLWRLRHEAALSPQSSGYGAELQALDAGLKKIYFDELTAQQRDEVARLLGSSIRDIFPDIS